ncbi:hypothetical protein ACL02P_24050 [Paenibacillus sp. MB22_1]|uniref:Uncharacterized protein n=2 Tax=Paenibacillus TaxID=44249 RepID=A0A919XSB2_9BACL|nr:MULTISPECIES: hypothetical protein [Paenibacillus]EES72627.1 hypothetical protein POTG_02791 [Paenibacillus sp. oral taxon 786 str. D14]GIO38119.1 hypothetical protein J41TS12_29800 [Paenibacillus antibioticophila]
MMSREAILDALLSATAENENMMWMLAALRMAERPVQKEQLRDVTNALYKKIHPDVEQEKLPIRSRHLLDEAAAMLEGASLVQVAEVAKSKRYTLSPLGEELLNYRQYKLMQERIKRKGAEQ